jgi:hypothetical protein
MEVRRGPAEAPLPKTSCGGGREGDRDLLPCSSRKGSHPILPPTGDRPRQSEEGKARPGPLDILFRRPRAGSASRHPVEPRHRGTPSHADRQGGRDRPGRRWSGGGRYITKPSAEGSGRRIRASSGAADRRPGSGGAPLVHGDLAWTGPPRGPVPGEPVSHHHQVPILQALLVSPAGPVPRGDPAQGRGGHPRDRPDGRLHIAKLRQKIPASPRHRNRQGRRLQAPEAEWDHGRTPLHRLQVLPDPPRGRRDRAPYRGEGSASSACAASS